MAFNYKIIKHIATLSETQDERKQVNIISYNNSKPKFDIRNWFGDNQMGKGITLDEEEWEELRECFNDSFSDINDYTGILEDISWLNSTGVHKYEIVLEAFNIEVDCESELVIDEEQQMICYKITFQTDKTKMQKYIKFLNDTNKYFADSNIFANAYVDFEDAIEFIKISGKIPLTDELEENLDEVYDFLSDHSKAINEIGGRKSKQIYFDNVIVVGDLLACVHQEHKREELFILVDFVRKDGGKFSIETKASYCEKCNLFFVRTHDYRMIKINACGAKMLCQEIEYERYCKNPDFRKLNLNDHSILNVYGYNVNAIENLTHTQRQEILASMVDRQIITKERIASYLAFFIRGAQNQKKDMSAAIDKWHMDRNYILDYTVGSRKKVEPVKITVIKYKPSKQEVKI